MNSYPEEVWVTSSPGGVLPAGAVEIAPATAAWHLDAWLGEGGGDRRELAELAAQAGLAWPFGPAMPAARIRSLVREALSRGELRAYRVKVALASSAMPAPPPESRRPEQVREEEKTFVVIELVDDADPPRPVPFEKYRVELPDHSIREGILDENGRAELRGIVAGSCKVTFPRLSREDWWLA